MRLLHVQSLLQYYKDVKVFKKIDWIFTYCTRNYTVWYRKALFLTNWSVFLNMVTFQVHEVANKNPTR